MAESSVFSGGDKRISRGGLVLRGPNPWIDPRSSPYNVDVTGTTKDLTANTQALQSALNDGLLQESQGKQGSDILLGAGTFKINNTLIIPHGDFQYGANQLLGQSRQATSFKYEGPTDRPAIFVDKQAHYSMGNFSVAGDSSNRGTSTGILFSGSEGRGTQTISGSLLPLLVSGFSTGVHLGTYQDNERSISEHVFQFLELLSCDVGLWAGNQNTLNILIHFLNTWQCGIGLQTQGAGNVRVLMGAGADNLVSDFSIGSSTPHVSIEHWRTERANRVLKCGSAWISLDHIDVADYRQGHDGKAIEIDGQAAINLSNSNLGHGTIHTRQGGTHLQVTNSNVGGSQYLYPLEDNDSLFGNTVMAQGSSVNGILTGAQSIYTGHDNGELKLVQRLG